MKKAQIILVFGLLGCNSLFGQTQPNSAEVKVTNTSSSISTSKPEKPKQAVLNTENAKPLSSVSRVKPIASRKEVAPITNH